MEAHVSHNAQGEPITIETMEEKAATATLADCDVESFDVATECDFPSDINNSNTKKCLPDDAAERGSKSNRKESDNALRTIQSNEESISESDGSQSTIDIDTVEQEEEVTPQGTAIGTKESIDINRFKIIVILILLAVATVASTCVLVFIKRAEQSQFEAAFHDDALKVLESVRNSIDNTLMPLDNLAVALVSNANAQKEEWPYVTLNDYAVRVAKVLPLTDAIYIAVLPVVTPANRLRWENYSSTHDDWVEESFAIQDNWELYYGPKNLTYNPEVEEWEAWAAEISGPFGPLEANNRCDLNILLDVGC